MHPLRRSGLSGPDWTLPVWVLGAAAPIVAALGIVGGVATATYFGAPMAAPPHTTDQPTFTTPMVVVGADVPSPVHVTPVPTTQVSPPYTPVVLPTIPVDLPPRAAPTSDGGANASEKPQTPALAPVVTPTPVQPRSMRSLLDARALLSESFSTYQSSAGTVAGIDYQPMRNTGLSTSLVGMVPVRAYKEWVRILETEPERLNLWLQSAAKSVAPAISRDRFFLAWAVVEVLPTRPEGFADYEVTALANGSFLVVRPLAATNDPSETNITLRSAASLETAASVNRPASVSGPWVTYGPVIRFDATDLYRPRGSTTTRSR